MPPQTYTQWTLNGQNGIESLVSSQADLPSQLGEHEVLVKIHAVSLNYRDIAMINVLSSSFPSQKHI